MNQDYDAAEALAAIGDARATLAAASATPPLRHFAFAALMGALVAAPAVPLPIRFLVLAGAAVGIALIVRWDRRRTGMFINGYRAGATRPLTFALLAVWMVLYALSNWLAIGQHRIWPSIALALVATGVGYIASQHWCRVFAREMRRS